MDTIHISWNPKGRRKIRWQAYHAFRNRLGLCIGQSLRLNFKVFIFVIVSVTGNLLLVIAVVKSGFLSGDLGIGHLSTFWLVLAYQGISFIAINSTCRRLGLGIAFKLFRGGEASFDRWWHWRRQWSITWKKQETSRAAPLPMTKFDWMYAPVAFSALFGTMLYLYRSHPYACYLSWHSNKHHYKVYMLGDWRRVLFTCTSLCMLLTSNALVTLALALQWEVFLSRPKSKERTYSID